MKTLEEFVKVYDGALDPKLCRHVVQTFESMPQLQVPNGIGARPGLEQSGWVEMDVSRLPEPRFHAFIVAQVQEYYAKYNQACRLTLPISPIHRLSDVIIKRYRPGGTEKFQVHFDALREVSNRYLVFLWYLNDVEQGGETEFPDLGVKVKAAAGRLLMFPPYWLYQHAGLPPVSGDKYIMSTYALY